MAEKSSKEKIEILLPKDAYKEPIDWETVTEEELIRRSSIYSYNIHDVRKRLRARQNWIKFIVAHLYVDHILTSLITENLKKPDVYKSDSRRKYVLDKLEICEAMGWIDPDVSKIVKKLNSIRNSLSHDLNFIVSRNLTLAFENSFSKKFKDILRASMKDAGTPEKAPPLSQYLELLLILIDQNRQAVLRQQYLSRRQSRELHKAMVNARRVLQEIKGSA